MGMMQESTETELRKAKKRFATAKKGALKAADELYDAIYFNEFNHEVKDELKAIGLSKDFTLEEFHQKFNKIGMVMDKASKNFDWNSPLLDLIPDVV